MSMSEPPTPLAAVAALGVLTPPLVEEAADAPVPRSGASGELEHPNHEHVHKKTHQRGTIDKLRSEWHGHPD